MKKNYKKPIITIQRFVANEYVAACKEIFDCYAPVADMQKGGILFCDDNNSQRLDDGDYVVNAFTKGIGFNVYKPCNAKHEIDSGGYQKGFLVDTSDFNGAKTWDWYRLPVEQKRRTFVWNNFKTTRSVYIWNAEFSSTQKGWHASSTQPKKNHS